MDALIARPIRALILVVPALLAWIAVFAALFLWGSQNGGALKSGDFGTDILFLLIVLIWSISGIGLCYLLFAPVLSSIGMMIVALMALRAKTPDIRRYAADNLAGFASERVSSLLERTLSEDPSADVRVAATRALGRRHSQRTVRSLLLALHDLDARVRGTAAGVLHEFHSIDAQVTEALIEALQDADAFVRRSAAEALKRIGDQQVLGPLVAVANDSDAQVRQIAIWALGRTRDRPSVELLVAALRDESWEVRCDAARILGQIGDERAVEPLMQALKDETWHVRREVVEALGYLGDERAVEPLMETLNGVSDYAYMVVVEALGRIGSAAVEPLLQVLEKENRIIDERREVIRALGQSGDARAAVPLVGLANDREVAGVTVAALQKILEQSSAQISPEGLRSVAALNNTVIQAVSHWEPYDDGYGFSYESYETEEPVDCTQVRHLAWQELHRRGLEQEPLPPAQEVSSKDRKKPWLQRWKEQAIG